MRHAYIFKKIILITLISIVYLILKETELFAKNHRLKSQIDSQLNRISDFYEDAEDDVFLPENENSENARLKIHSKLTIPDRKLPWNIWVRVYGEKYSG